MIYFDKSKNLLEEDKYHYQLQDVPEPELFRDIYPYDEIPKVVFNYRHVPMDMPAEIWITDTTFRDGQQSTSPFTVQQIVDLFKLMSRLGGPKGIVRQSEFFLYSEKDRAALKACQDLGLKFPEITTWIRANEKDFELVKQAGVAETGILVSCSDYHIFKKMNLTRAQAMDKYLGIVKSALAHGIKPRCHFEDLTRADFYGFVVPFANELMKLSRESGIPIKIRMCDTMPSELLEWHGHNDFYKVVTNATTAWLYGASSVNCSLLGIGERTGNCPLEAMAIEYASLRGTADGMDLSAITDIASYFETELGYIIPPQTPFVGRSFNATRAGIHADGMLKDPEIYNIFDTEKILNRPARVSINNASGLAGIAYWINDYYYLTDEHKIDKKDDLVLKMKEIIDAEYAAGRNSIWGDDELDNMIRQLDKDRHLEFEAFGRVKKGK